MISSSPTPATSPVSATRSSASCWAVASLLKRARDQAFDGVARSGGAAEQQRAGVGEVDRRRGCRIGERDVRDGAEEHEDQRDAHSFTVARAAVDAHRPPCGLESPATRVRSPATHGGARASSPSSRRRLGSGSPATRVRSLVGDSGQSARAARRVAGDSAQVASDSARVAGDSALIGGAAARVAGDSALIARDSALTKTPPRARSDVGLGDAPPRLRHGVEAKTAPRAPVSIQAHAAGFRAIDTANQRKHYHEAGVGEALRAFLAAHHRDELWLHTKYTYMAGQDARLPYAPDAPIGVQVAQSCRSSLVHLGVDRLDSVLLRTALVARRRSRPRRPPGVARARAAGRRRPHRAHRQEQRHRAPGRRARRVRADRARVRAEPLPRVARLGSRRSRRVRAPRHRVPGVLAAHRQPHDLRPPRRRRDRAGARRHGRAGRAAVRAAARDDPGCPVIRSIAQHARDDVAIAALELTAAELRAVEQAR